MTETRPFECHNIVALLEGSDPVLKEEYIVVGAHLDHLGIAADGQVMNGADDNASGTAAVIEAAEAAAMDPPKRSVIFVLYTVEEKGWLGSAAFVRRTAGVPPEKIVLNINADMVGRNSTRFPESILVLASEKDRQGLLEMIKRATDDIGCPIIDLRLHDSDSGAHAVRGDQINFESEGIPWVLVTRGFMGPDYHRPSDDPETVNYDKVVWSSKLMYALLREAGNAEKPLER